MAKGQETRNGQPPEEAAVSAAAGLTFHHFPIPDLSPAENMAVLSGLVDDLELLVTAGKVGLTCARNATTLFVRYAP